MVRCIRHVAVCLSLAMCLLAGCSDSETTSVKGSITYKGKPVTFGIINFRDDSPQPRGGPIASDGTYQFNLPPGSYQVRIDAGAPPSQSAVEGVAPPPQSRLVPEKFADYGSSGLSATVTADNSEQTIDFKLD